VHALWDEARPVDHRGVPTRIASVIAAAAAVLAAFSPTAAAETPRSAAAFRDSIGVNTHVTYLNTPYGRWSRILDKLEALGVTHLRDAAFGDPTWGDWNRQYYANVQAAAARGMRFNLIMGKPANHGGTLDQLVTAAAGPLAGAVESLEGPNEYDVSGGSWAPQLRTYQQDLYDKVKRHPALRTIPVVGPSFVWASSRPTMGNLGPALDVGNMHPYTGGRSPTAAHIKSEITLTRRVSGRKPIIATEAGFHNSVAATSGQPGVPESVAAVYTLRTHLEHFLAGVDRTYLYELIDQWTDAGGRNPEAHFGLLRNDFSEKPAFVALRNLLAIVGTPSSPANRRALPLELTGDTTGVRDLLLQRGDGSYLVVLWQTGSLWDTTTERPRTLAGKDVRVSVGSRVTARRYRPARSGSGSNVTLGAEGTRVSLPGDPVILEIPAEAAAPSKEARTMRATLARWMRGLRRSRGHVRVTVRQSPRTGVLRVELLGPRSARRGRRSGLQRVASTSACA
jgi:hypothetical protein